MSMMIAEDVGIQGPRYADPSALLSCDNPDCDAPWVTGSGLVVWEVHADGPVSRLFTDRLLVACNADCLRRAQAQQKYRHWSAPMAVAEWLDLLAVSIACDPETTEIGAYVSSAE